MANPTYFNKETLLPIIKSLKSSELIFTDNDIIVELIKKYNPTCNVEYKRDELHRERNRLNLTECKVIILMCSRESTVEFIQNNDSSIQLYVLEVDNFEKQLLREVEELENLTP